ncbi:hypothetical protein TH25_00540 [Thalassospira profundimaris]|uniref:N-acetyltransferase domain-containing protein n=1 Tax=Thalassospira profundimaris TaxID=502049 RepID=A0A367XK25_9PROT|nr:GNAT family N-acetyltransferase [Thalassospira profundimaris]RCK53898.1 hypothetical protein TH25_00540 [Thalassospira profundimaris]
MTTQTAAFEIVELTPAYAAVAAALHQTGFEECWDETAICDLLAVPGAFGLLAFVPQGNLFKGETIVSDMPLGFVLVQTVLDEAEINTIVVDAKARRHGVGNVLMQGVFARLQNQASTRLLLEVAIDNAAAIALYRKLGFAEIGRRRGYYRRKDRPAVDALVMERV